MSLSRDPLYPMRSEQGALVRAVAGVAFPVLSNITVHFVVSTVCSRALQCQQAPHFARFLLYYLQQISGTARVLDCVLRQHAGCRPGPGTPYGRHRERWVLLQCVHSHGEMPLTLRFNVLVSGTTR